MKTQQYFYWLIKETYKPDDTRLYNRNSYIFLFYSRKYLKFRSSIKDETIQ